MTGKECLEEILSMLNYEQIDECDKKGLLRTINQDLNRLEQLEKIIKENFGYNENTKECFFNYDAPVMEEEIKEALGYEKRRINEKIRCW